AAGTSLERQEAFGRPLYQEGEEGTGRRYTTATGQLRARPPTPEEGGLPQIPPRTPGLGVLPLPYDPPHRPVEAAPAPRPGPMTTLTEEYRIPGPRPGLPDEPGLALG